MCVHDIHGTCEASCVQCVHMYEMYVCRLDTGVQVYIKQLGFQRCYISNNWVFNVAGYSTSVPV